MFHKEIQIIFLWVVSRPDFDEILESAIFLKKFHFWMIFFYQKLSKKHGFWWKSWKIEGKFQKIWFFSMGLILFPGVSAVSKTPLLYLQLLKNSFGISAKFVFFDNLEIWKIFDFFIKDSFRNFSEYFSGFSKKCYKSLIFRLSESLGPFWWVSLGGKLFWIIWKVFKNLDLKNSHFR